MGNPVSLRFDKKERDVPCPEADQSKRSMGAVVIRIHTTMIMTICVPDDFPSSQIDLP